jgi:predicted nucleic-acid-binding protein
LIDANEIFVSTTVLLETEWVLRSVYGIPSSRFGEAIRGFAGLPAVTLEDPPLANLALTWMDGGLAFADAIHLAKAGESNGFVTFDRSFVRAAKKIGLTKVRLPERN